MLEPSILNSVKRNLGIDVAYTVFDHDILTFINTALSTLNELGVGPPLGLTILDDNDTWNDFLEDGPMLDSAKTYVYLRVRLLFDPPATSFAITAFERQLEQLEWRMNVRREGTEWVDPNVEVVVDE